MWSVIKELTRSTIKAVISPQNYVNNVLYYVLLENFESKESKKILHLNCFKRPKKKKPISKNILAALWKT